MSDAEPWPSVVQFVRSGVKQDRTHRTIKFGHLYKMTELPRHRLMQARKAAGFATPSEAARAHKRTINQNTLISHENGNREISRKAAAKYGDAFGVDPGWILFGDAGAGATSEPSFITADVPLISWVSAGEMALDMGSVDLAEFPTVAGVDLPAGDYIALRVVGNSMNKISPPDSIIFVDTANRRLVPNGLYVVADETGAATYKRYRPGDEPHFQPASYDEVDPPDFTGAVRVVGRVRRSMIDT